MSMKWNDTPHKNPLARARGLGAAHSGVTHWWHQRITAVSNLVLMGWLIWTVTQMPVWTYETFTVWLAHPVNAVLMILTILSTFYHAVLGTQVVVEDYVHNEGFKIVKLAAIRLAFIAAGVAGIFSILKIAFA
ncbi:succinate dehydrogenase, hydrophobic membrane anchor protein [Micavibrio aeruginosavorus]|uniref:Succinate dehydrogenase hydrophobic membrane anchor subunit n=1 Tax=Micavibrio aeruginosavorus (strain ARL-13) TaxID=856793 RepID=G2KMD9_MICAA|nr:succinate dehydrogenase, hydrophobic membrane anchor protein [Micavibrio aeruginosavorus]AEP10233.1 succinate dehydrogenase, hydrophobic membrane anchor protein [Micavibrio aeruginosavorus ARL-13]